VRYKHIKAHKNLYKKSTSQCTEVRDNVINVAKYNLLVMY